MLLIEKPSTCVPNFVVILLFPLIFFLSILYTYYEFATIELHTVVIIGFIFFIFLTFIRHNANVINCQILKSLDTIQDRLDEHLLNHQVTLNKQTKSLINLEEFLTHNIKSYKNDNFANVASTIFPMLGILGTFISIAVSIPDFSSQDLKSLDRDISILLSGVATAFYASIYGIFLSIWWIFFEKRGDSKIDRLMLSIKRNNQKHIWSNDELTRYSYMQSNLHNQEIIETFKEIFNVDFVKDINQEYLEKFKEVTHVSERSMNNMVEGITNISKRLDETIAKISHADNAIDASKAIDEKLRDFIIVTKELQETIDTIDSKLVLGLEGAFDKIDIELAKAINHLSEFSILLDEKFEKIENVKK